MTLRYVRDRADAGDRRRVLDVAALPDHAFGHHGLIWWGTLGFMVIEGAMLLMVLIAYYYLRLRVDQWPPGVPLPGLQYGTMNLLLMTVSLVPAHLTKVAAERYDLRKVRLWLIVLTLFGVAATVLRALEFTTLNCRWDSGAYGSIVWFVIGLHTTHLVTDVVDGGVLAALMFSSHVEPKRFVDVSENSLYWYYIVAWWVPYYLTIYFAPRWL
jgi:heme/copper-type cytochrome/quinol oxidase subunit 3